MSDRGRIRWIGRVWTLQPMLWRVTMESRSDRAHSARYTGLAWFHVLFLCDGHVIEVGFFCMWNFPIA